MPLPRIQRGEIWLVDLGYLGKVRPVAVLSVPFLPNERTFDPKQLRVLEEALAVVLGLRLAPP